MAEAGGPQILADQKAPPDSGGEPHYYLPTQIFSPCAIPAIVLKLHFSENVDNIKRTVETGNSQ